MFEKPCIICKVFQPLSEYYAHKMMADGHLNKCKTCTKRQSKEREEVLRQIPEWKEQEKERHRDKYYRLGYKDKHKPTAEDKKQAVQKYRAKYPEKYINRKCLYKGTNEHHWSYLPEHRKDTMTLMSEDHYTIHRFIVYDEVEFKYRSKEGLLLDSKEVHAKYAETVVPGFEDRVRIHIEGLQE